MAWERPGPVTLAEEREVGLSTRILVVEDDLIQQQVLERFLTSHGYEVATAATGLEAIKRIRDDWFDVIILDYAMPGFDGVDAAKWIRREVDGLIRPCLVALSANVRDMLDEVGVTGIFDHVEQKPWNPRALLSVLQGFRNGSRSEGPPPGDEADAPLLRVTTCLEKVRVLVVDEEESVLSTFRASLEEVNYEVSLAHGRAEAVRALGAGTFDIVFSDYFGASKFCGSPAAFLRQAC